jgi:CheY-like chemotaxis protein
VPKEEFTVLLVEDNFDHAELVLRSFRDHHFPNAIQHVPDGEAALDYLFQRGAYADPAHCPKPHVILLDLRLPKVDGLEVLKTIKADECLRRIPVVILTTSQAEMDIAKAYDNHANSYLVKPVDFSMFSELMKELGCYWLDWNKRPQATC